MTVADFGERFFREVARAEWNIPPEHSKTGKPHIAAFTVYDLRRTSSTLLDENGSARMSSRRR